MKSIKYLAIVLSLSLSTAVFAATGSTDTGSTSTGAVIPNTSTLEVKGAPRLVKKTTDSVTLEWDTVTGATAYIVKYSKASVADSKDPNAQYDNETDQITTTGAVITELSSIKEKLTPNTPYYFSIVAIDKDGKESDTFSDELMVTTDGVVPAFAIKTVTVIDDKNITLTFSSEISNDPVAVKITKTNDHSNVGVESVTKDMIKSDTVNIVLSSLLSPSSSYTIVVLSAKDVNGNNIQEGVSSLNEFTTSDTLKTTVVTPPVVIDNNLNAASASGAALIADTASGAISPESATKVATGTQENLLVLAALILSLGIVYIYRRKLV